MKHSENAKDLASLPTRPRQARSEKTVERILDAAVQIVLENGIEALVMRQVALKAEVGQATLYTYFPSKEFLVAGLVERLLEKVEKVLSTLPELSPPLSESEFVTRYLDPMAQLYQSDPVFGIMADRAFSSSTSADLENRMDGRFLESFLRDLEVAFPGMTNQERVDYAMFFLETADALLVAGQREGKSEAVLHEKLAVMLTCFLEAHTAGRLTPLRNISAF